MENDYNVVISNSRGPETLSALIAELGPKARAATAVEAAKAGDIVVVTVPLKNYRKVPVEPLAGKIVIDTDNYYPERDGHIPELDNEWTTTSELLQAHLPTSKVVKAFNHIYAADLTTHGQPAGAKNRRALVIAGDDKDAKARVTHLLDQFGFDTKPFDTMELIARIEAILRRSTTKPTQDVLQFETIRVDLRGTEVTRDGKPVPLSPREFQLLRYLIEHEGATVSRADILHEVWGYEEGTFTRTVDVHVASLRQKLEESPKNPKMILTIPGLGYKFQGS